MTSPFLVFQDTRFDILDRNGQPWLKAAQIAQALGYSRDYSLSRVYDRHKYEFADGMIDTVKLTASGNIQTETRIVSLRGAHLLGMFARTAKAKEFRKWVLDMLDGLAGKTQPLSGPLSDKQVRAAYTAMSATIASLPLDEASAMIFVIDSIKEKFGAHPPGINAAKFDELIGFIDGLRVGAKGVRGSEINQMLAMIGMRAVPLRAQA